MNIFIIEGTDGVGKSSFIAELKRRLTYANFKKFPSEYPDPEMAPEAEIGFYLSDFNKTLAGLNEDDTLICDRSFISTLAYQGFEAGTTDRNEFFDHISSESFKTFFPNPARTRLYYLQLVCDLDVAMKRTGVRLGGLGEGEIDAIDRLDPASKRKELSLLNDRYAILYHHLWNLVGDTHGMALSMNRIDSTKASTKELVDTVLKTFPIKRDFSNEKVA